MFLGTVIFYFVTNVMDQNIRDLIAIRQAEATQKIAQQTAPSTGPQCPYCGGIAARNYERCKNCASPISWVEGRPCKPGGEDQLANQIKQEKKVEYLRQSETERRNRENDSCFMPAMAMLMIFAAPVPLALWIAWDHKNPVGVFVFTYIAQAFVGCLPFIK